MTKTIVRKRVNVSLPQDTLRLIERVARPGDRSRFLADAVRFYVKEAGRTRMHALLREGAIKRSDRDLGLVEEWFPLEHEIWQKNKKRR